MNVFGCCGTARSHPITSHQFVGSGVSLRGHRVHLRLSVRPVRDNGSLCDSFLWKYIVRYSFRRQNGKHLNGQSPVATELRPRHGAARSGLPVFPGAGTNEDPGLATRFGPGCWGKLLKMQRKYFIYVNKRAPGMCYSLDAWTDARMLPVSLA